MISLLLLLLFITQASAQAQYELIAGQTLCQGPSSDFNNGQDLPDGFHWENGVSSYYKCDTNKQECFDICSNLPACNLVDFYEDESFGAFGCKCRIFEAQTCDPGPNVWNTGGYRPYLKILAAAPATAAAASAALTFRAPKRICGYKYGTCATISSGQIQCSNSRPNWGFEGVTSEFIAHEGGEKYVALTCMTNGEFLCGLTELGNIRCYNDNNQLLLPTFNDGTISAETGRFVYLDLENANYYRSLAAIRDDGSLELWGKMKVANNDQRVRTPEAGNQFVDVQAGGRFNAVLESDGSVTIYQDGNLGTRLQNIGGTTNIISILKSDMAICAVTETGEGKCVGYSINDQTRTAASGGRYVHGGCAGFYHLCFVVDNGKVECFMNDANDYGVPPEQKYYTDYAPQIWTPTASSFVQCGCGLEHTSCLRADGVVETVPSNSNRALDRQTCSCANGVASCPDTPGERCSSCNDGYALGNNVCVLRTCAVGGIVALADSCFCAGGTTLCGQGKWCYDSGCQNAPLYPACTPHITSAVATECGCGTMTTTCTVGKYCWNNACTDAAHCQPRTNAQRKAFFGAKLHGTWDANARTMNMYLPAPNDVTITEIKWKDATNGDALKYTSAAHGLWTVDTNVNACIPQYTLNVAEATFFGDGSKFTLTGTRMDTKLEVTASEAVTQTIDGTSYSFTREMKNEVHLDVELVQQVTINAHFTTRYTAAPNVDTIRINADFATINGQLTAFLNECNTLVGAGVTCTSIAEGSVIITFTGEAAAIAAAIASLNAAGIYSTTNFGPYVIMQSHTEFVFVTGSENTDLENGDLQVKLKLEVHSRSCVNHATGTGVAVDSESTQYLKADTTPTYAWIMDENDSQSVAHTFANNLCVETLWWTWIPRDYQSSSYNIALDWTLRNGLTNFVTNAEIDIQRADVLATIGFTTNVALYTDAAATTSAEGTFNLGDKFYAKISLTNMVVDAQSITCSAMEISQSPPNGGDNVVTDMKGNAIYNFVETQSSTNNVICGAELDSTHFHVSAEGYATNLNIDITVNYIQGVQSISRRRMLSIPVSGEREPEEDAVSIEFEITSLDELALGVAEFANENRILTAKYALFTTFLGFSWYAYGMTKGGKNQAEQYDELLI